MTLSTNIIALDPIDPERAFLHVAKLIGADEGYRFEVRTPEENVFRQNYSIMAEPGQGKCAWLIVTHNNGELDIRDEEFYTSDKNDPRIGGEDGLIYRPAGYADVDVDTAYGYGHYGTEGDVEYGGCSDLHAWIVREYTKWLDHQGVRWAWRNEYTGEWFEDLDSLADFGDADLGGRNPELRHVEISGA